MGAIIVLMSGERETTGSEALEFLGTWWLPQLPSIQAPGRFSFDTAKGGTLELHGVLLGVGPNEHPPAVLGLTAKNEPVTLLRCFNRFLQLNVPGFGRQTIHAAVCVMGVHFEDPRQFRVREVEAHLTALEAWAQEMPVNFKRDQADRRMDLSYRLPEDVDSPVTLARAVSVSVRAVYVHRTSLHGVQQTPSFRIADRYGGHFDGFWEDLHRLRDLVTLGLDRPTHLYGLSASTPRGDVKIYSQPVSTHEDAPEREPLFRLTDLRKEAPAILGGWVRSARQLHAVHSLYFSTRYSSQYVEQRLLSLAQATEIFHRLVFGGSYVPGEEFLQTHYPKFVAAIPSTASSDWGQALTAKLQYLHEYSLRRRVRELLDAAPSSLASRIAGGSLKDFAARVTAVRNALTHSGPMGEEDLQETFKLAERLAVLLEAWLLAQAGASWTLVEELFNRHRRTAWRLS